MPPPPPPTTPSIDWSPGHVASRSARWGIGLSLSIHGAVLGLLALSAVPGWSLPRTPSVLTVTATRAAETAQAKETPPVAIEPNARAPDAIDSEVVQARISAAIAAADETPLRENLDQLGRLESKLDGVTNEQSLDDVAKKLQDWMGLRERVTEPVGQTTLETFDLDSAQLHDVKRQATADQSFQYLAILIDQQGHTFEIEMGPVEGATAYELMRRIKANPLLKKLYRGLAMPLLDQLLQPLRDAATTSRSLDQPRSIPREPGAAPDEPPAPDCS